MYYKDDTHYFVMTAKKQCLLRLGVLLQVGPGPREEEAGRDTVYPILSRLCPGSNWTLTCSCSLHVCGSGNPIWAELKRELQDRRMLSLFLWLGVNSQGLEWYLMSG